MVDYEFYTAVYQGSAIPEKAFSGMASRAEAVLEGFSRAYRVRNAGADSVKMAVCAMAEVLYGQEKRRGVQSASVGGVSVRYDSDSRLTGQLYRAAGIYLDFYRGVS